MNEGSGSLGTLLQAEKLMSAAVTLSPGCPEALIEFAFYLYSVKCDSRKALALFTRGKVQSIGLLTEAYLGEIRCLWDLGQRRRARMALESALRIFGKDARIKELSRELTY